MEHREKIKELLSGMGAEEQKILQEELRANMLASRPRVSLEEITSTNLNDPEFSRRVRNEIHSALRGEI